MSEKIDLEIDSQKRHMLFIDRIIENETVWGLKLRDEDGWAVAPSNEYEDIDVMVFWSDRAYAQSCAREEWSDYVPTPIPLELYLKNWLHGLDEDRLLVGTNWNAALVGMEIEPIDLLDEIVRRIKQSQLKAEVFNNDRVTEM